MVDRVWYYNIYGKEFGNSREPGEGTYDREISWVGFGFML